MRALGAELVEHRRRLPGSARRSDAARGLARPGAGSLVPPRSRARRRDLRARTPERASGPRCALRPDRPGLGDLRLHRRARRAGAEDRDRRRAIDGSAGLRACRSRPDTWCTTNSADTLADGMATRVPDEEALDGHPQGRCSHRAGQRRRDRRRDPRLLDRYAQSRRRRGSGAARRRLEGKVDDSRARKSASSCRAATSISISSSAGSSARRAPSDNRFPR